MSAHPENYIAGWKTDDDWRAVRGRLIGANAAAWLVAFNDYFVKRLDLRYLTPIRVLQENGANQGEGFAIAAIQCSLIEFLESTAQGINYRYLPRGQVPGAYEYSMSKDVFVAFLCRRHPFSNTFNEDASLDFYINVRCGLLHEARTKGGWRIWAVGPIGIVADLKQRIVYRNNFQQALLTYIDSYKVAIQLDTDLQEAFIRKFDSLCD